MLLLVIGLILAMATVFISRPAPVQIVVNPPPPTATPLATFTPSPLLVYITGAVQQPETTVSLAYGSRVMDAIAAAGGLLENADSERINLAGKLQDGDHIHVPAINEIIALPTDSTNGLIFINFAEMDELITLPGIGETTASRIIEYRDLNGPFENLNDLDQVKGIGQSLLEKIAPFVSFEQP
ncbi:ComEA family DNA-binding protein [Anaerolineales bacterium]